jgi:hypothetical protein
MGKHSAKAPLIDKPTLRTAFQAFVGFCVIAPVVFAVLGIDSTTGFAATALGITAGITRLMQLPAFNEWLEKYLPWLAKQ